MKLGVPHFKQETPHTCLSACVRMILAYRGKTHSEHELALAFQTVPDLGAPPENVEPALKLFGYQVRWFENATLERLELLLAHDWPVILFLRAIDLPQGRGGLHSIVLGEIDDRYVTCLEPMLDDNLQIEQIRFVEIWSRLGNQGMVVWP
jgi:ABC-type bacteriocin/lantibiotic exporter with double-glycine peptidase domain